MNWNQVKRFFVMVFCLSVFLLNFFDCPWSICDRGKGLLELDNANIEELLDESLAPQGTPAIRGKELREDIMKACKSKILCELGAKPIQYLTVKEREILWDLRLKHHWFFRSKSAGEWSFPALMGSLFGTVFHVNAVPDGCNTMYPNCPLTRKELDEYKFR